MFEPHHPWVKLADMIEVMSRCPVCQARVNVNAGAPTPPHKAEGSDAQCAGTGQPTK